MLMQALDAALLDLGSAICLADGTGREATGYALHADVGRYAATLLSLGAAPGDRILMAVAKALEVPALYLAALRVGAVPVPLAADVGQPALDAIIDDAQPAIFIASEQMVARSAQKLRMSRARSVLTFEDDGSGSLHGLAAGQQPARTSVLVRPSDLALLSYEPWRDPRATMFTHAALARHVELAGPLLGMARGETLRHALRQWSTPASLAFLCAAFTARVRIVWDADRSPAAADAWHVLLTDGEDTATSARRTVRPVSDTGRTKAQGTCFFMALPEAGLVAAGEDPAGLRVLAGLTAHIADGCLAIEDKALFSGYWRRTQDSERALKPGLPYRSQVAVRSEAAGIVVARPQP